MVGLGNLHNFPCADCRETPNKHITRIFGAALYDGAIAEAIKHFKFHRKPRLARPLGELMRDFALREMDTEIYARIVPVPLHHVRQRERGFNQSALLAEEVLPAFARATLDTTLKRIRPTRVQSRLEPKERRGNVRGAFAVEGPDCAGETLLLIDDVVTTGGTVTECARVLHKAGAARVDVLAAALAAPGQRLDDLVW
jgi:ComF family protein